MKPKVVRRPRAQGDILEIWLFVARDNEPAADRLLDRIDAALKVLSHNPSAGRDRSDLAPGLRSFVVGSYVLFYHPIQGGIDLVRILSGYRDIQPDLLG